MPKITDYEPVVGSHTIEELRILAGKLQGKVIQNINSTAVGGGVAEIINRMVPLLQELGVDARWDFIKGGESFFNVTKKFHNALHGKSEEITPQMFEIFMETSQRNIAKVKIYGDIMFIHDPQLIVLVKKKDSMPNSKWIWRCHIDVSTPIKQLLNSPEYAKRLGENGREHVRQNFLLTCELRDSMLLSLCMYHPEDIVYL